MYEYWKLSSLNFIETSFDLFESEKFNFKPREDYMMPMPFVNTK